MGRPLAPQHSRVSLFEPCQKGYGFDMRNEKIHSIDLSASIHTVSIRSTTLSPIKRKDVPWLTSVYNPQGSPWYIYRLNMNHTSCGEVFSLDAFEFLIQQAANELGLENWEYVRVDFRVDQSIDNYESLRKLNRLLITGLSILYGMDNRYESDDFLTEDKLTIRAGNERLQVENYNKSLQEPTNPTKNRLELRTLRVYEGGKDLYQLIEDWKDRLQQVIDNFDMIQAECNKNLLNRYQTETENRSIRKLSDFIWLHSSKIYCRPQMVKLLTAIGVRNPKTAANNYRSRLKGMEYFSKADLKAYVDDILESLYNFQHFDKYVKNECF